MTNRNYEKWKLTFSSPVATAEFSRFAGIFSGGNGKRQRNIYFCTNFHSIWWKFSSSVVSNSLRLMWPTLLLQIHHPHWLCDLAFQDSKEKGTGIISLVIICPRNLICLGCYVAVPPLVLLWGMPTAVRSAQHQCFWNRTAVWVFPGTSLTEALLFVFSGAAFMSSMSSRRHQCQSSETEVKRPFAQSPCPFALTQSSTYAQGQKAICGTRLLSENMRSQRDRP